MDLTGSHGGVVAAAAMASWAAATAFWMGVGTVIWRLFFEPRIKALQGQLEDERTRCDKDVEALRDRIKQLELLLMLHGPQSLRQHMQAALSEHSIAMSELKENRAND
ncbi:hypothetical protein [Sphingomonas baiyangensis]|uniref:Uncharacterized protein n=1 Tax=Sphingomonas baiyangensis TaxID=2572576 RepID=A0A4U1L243_9SPHN|nr:hypothetical protein [Sphingomonas baiyangensis]TKD50233.1 hypothetical protein FBR43_05280 [Sphingomonas baiyangensis]